MFKDPKDDWLSIRPWYGLGSSSFSALSCLHYRGRWCLRGISIICGEGRLQDRAKTIGDKKTVFDRIIAKHVTSQQ